MIEPRSAVVYQFPRCCRKRMIYQPARERFYCRYCGKLMERRTEFVPPPEVITGTTVDLTWWA